MDDACRLGYSASPLGKSNMAVHACVFTGLSDLRHADPCLVLCRSSWCRHTQESNREANCAAALLSKTGTSSSTQLEPIGTGSPRELRDGDPVRVSFQLLDFDLKRMHYFEALHHADENWLSATSENMALHIDMDARKTAAFPPEIVAHLARMKAAHASLPFHDGAGRRIAMPPK